MDILDDMSYGAKIFAVVDWRGIYGFIVVKGIKRIAALSCFRLTKIFRFRKESSCQICCLLFLKQFSVGCLELLMKKYSGTVLNMLFADILA